MTKLLSDENWKLLSDRIKREDEDRWLSSCYAPAEPRRRLIALYALNLELAKIRTSVSEPGIGAIRFQWWRDVAEELREGQFPRNHDVVRAIVEAELADKTVLGLIDGHQDAFEANDRELEPEALLIRAAAAIVVPAHSWGEHLQVLGPIYAAARRGDSKAVGPVLPRAPKALRPAIAHTVLREVYADGRHPGPLAKRFAIVKTIMTGRI